MKIGFERGEKMEEYKSLSKGRLEQIPQIGEKANAGVSSVDSNQQTLKFSCSFKRIQMLHLQV